jgi:NAD+ kinase
VTPGAGESLGSFFLKGVVVDLPTDLVLVRHGKSEGNAANRMSRRGDNSAFTKEFMARPSSAQKLTSKGIKQAKISGKWIKENISELFDNYYVSEHTRAIESAAYLDLPQASWHIDFNLREREWGDLDVMPQDVRRIRFPNLMENLKIDPFRWRPPNGESMVDLCHRVSLALLNIYRECPNKKVIVVCHSETMWAFRILIEKLSRSEYNFLQNDFNPREYTKYYHNHNGQVIHYSRRDKSIGKLYSDWSVVRTIYPYDMSKTPGSWRSLRILKYDNTGLLTIANKNDRMIDDE